MVVGRVGDLGSETLECAAVSGGGREKESGYLDPDMASSVVNGGGHGNNFFFFLF